MRDILQRCVQKAHSSFRQAPRVIGVIVLVFMLVSSPMMVGTSQAQEEGTITVTAYDATGTGVGTVTVNRTQSIEGDGFAFDITGDTRSAIIGDQVAEWDNVRYSGGELIASFEDGDLAEYTTAGDGTVNWGVTSDVATDGTQSLRAQAAQENAFLYPDGMRIKSDFSFDMRQSGPNGFDNLRSGMRVFYNTDTNGGYRIFVNEATGEMTLSVVGGAESETTAISGYTSTNWYTYEVEVTGGFPDPEEPEETQLTIETRDLYTPNSTHPYEVILENVSRVTENATVTSSNTTLLSVDQQEHTMTSIDDENATGVVNVTATYTYEGEEYNTTKTVVVAQPSMQNLELLPTGLWRTYAVMSDNTVFALIIAALFSVAAARFAGAFAGLATAEMVIVIGWLGGYVGLGIAMVSVFMCMFIGLNLAANVDYSVTRMERP